MRPVRISLIITVLFFVSAVVPMRADTIVLQNGRTLKGEIIGQSEDHIDIRIGTGKFKFNRKDVKSIEINEPAEGYSEPEKNTDKEAGGEAKETKPLLKLNVAAEYTNGRIKVTGKSGLSPDAQINVYFIRQNDIITMKQASVKGGDFFVTFGPFEKQILSAGKYTIDAKGLLKGQVIAAGSCPLVVGTATQISKDEGDERQRLSWTAAKAQALYDELNNAYAKNKENFDKKKWDEWSAGWLRNANDQVRTLEAYSRTNVAVLYPKAHRGLGGCMHQIILLHTVYSSEFAKQKDAGKVNENPQMPMANPQFLNGSIAASLAEVRKEIEAK